MKTKKDNFLWNPSTPTLLISDDTVACMSFIVSSTSPFIFNVNFGKKSEENRSVECGWIVDAHKPDFRSQIVALIWMVRCRARGIHFHCSMVFTFHPHRYFHCKSRLTRCIRLKSQCKSSLQNAALTVEKEKFLTNDVLMFHCL